MRLFLLVLTACCANFVNAQTAEDSVKATVNKLFLAMKNSDVEMMKSTFAPTAVLQTIDTKDGVKVSSEDVNGFAEGIKSIAKGDADEQITFETIKIDADLASVWTPYRFIYKGKLSHCGVNSFQLVRLNKEWKIQYIIDTRRKTGCSN